MEEKPPAYTGPPEKGQPGMYPPSGQPGYPPQQGHPPPQQGYPPQQQGYPPQQQGYPPQQQGYPPQQQGYQASTHQNTTVITTQPVIPMMIYFNESPVAMTCPHCQANITTTTTFENGDKVWLWMFLFCCFGGLLCCWIPLVVDGFKDVVHTCPNCSTQLGVLKR